MDGEETGRVRYLSARQAAEELGISRATLYAYVSRGLIRSEATAGKRRNRHYRAEDVRRLKERKEQRQNPARLVESALHWGTPVLESGITLISDGGLYYRGQDVLHLATSSTLEEVAALIWAGDPAAAQRLSEAGPSALSLNYPALYQVTDTLTPFEAFQVLLPLAAVTDLAAYDLRPPAVARTGTRILRLMAVLASGEETAGSSIAETLQKGWGLPNPKVTELLDAALILCADHELNVSTFAARCVASSEATPYAVVTAGMSALQGKKHGGQTDLVEALLRESETSGDPRQAIAARLKHGESLPGFGHSLYPEGDPRGRELLRLVTESCPETPAVAHATTVAGEAFNLIGEHPTVDFGLVTLARALELPPGGAQALFAIGRTVGWIGHAIEQYESDSLIRPRARYVGVQPTG